MNKNLNRYTKLIILFIILYPLKLLYKKLNDNIKQNDIKNGYDLVNKFLVNEIRWKYCYKYKPKLWFIYLMIKTLGFGSHFIQEIQTT